MPYNPLYKASQIVLGNPDSQIVVVTGWTLLNHVTSKIPPHYYAAIGQLYSPARGLNLLVRNLLANPHIRWLVSLGVTKEDANSGAVKCLKDFFTHGVSKGANDSGVECWVVNSKVRGYIDIEIPLADLKTLREHLTHFGAIDIKDAAYLAKTFSDWEPQEAPYSSKVYPMTLVRSDTRPASIYAHKIEGDTIADCWLKVLHRIRGNGVLRPTRYGGEVQELVDLVTVIHHEPEGLHFADYLPVSREFIERSYLAHFMDGGRSPQGVEYSYGHRMRSYFGTDQVADLIQKLKDDPNSASGVINLWDSHQPNVTNAPCLNHVWVRIVKGSLSLTATLRSNDMFSAWVANTMALATLQRFISNSVDPQLDVGPLVVVSQSAHIYEDCFGPADKVLANHYKGARVTYDDPIGYFLIERDGSEVVISHMTPEGVLVDTYNGRNALPLLRRLVSDKPTIRASHAAYLGLELGRAFCQGEQYVQDR